MTEPDKLPSLEELGSGIRKFQEKISPQKPGPEQTNFGFALQVGLELASGAMVGGACGYFIDKWLGTSPIGLIVCFLFGCAGGFLTVMRTLKITAEDESKEDKR